MKTLLLHPFEKVPETRLFIFGTALLLLGSYLGYVFNGRYDGVIDLHFTQNATLFQPLIDNLINTFCLFTALYVTGKAINKKTRMIDILNPVLVARAPFYLLAFSNFRNYISDITKGIVQQIDPQKIPSDLNIGFTQVLFLGIFTILAIAFLVWFVMLLYNGFKTATNCKTTAHKLYFALSLLAAEIISGIAISQLNY